MHNLLRKPLTEHELTAVLAETAGRPALPVLGDAAWARAAANPALRSWLVPLLALADAEAGQPLPILTEELYQDFGKTGARLPFETVYFERRRRLGRAAMAVLLGDEETRTRLLPSFLRKFEEILAEDSWSLPAHVWDEPSGKNPRHIDLFAAECANNFAELLAVFPAVIPADLASRARARLHSGIFENYADRPEDFHWADAPMNWNAVCHQGVLGAALAIEDDPALVARMLTRAMRGLPRYLDGFGEDGSTSEGPGYWSYGFGWFSELNAQLEHRTRGRLSLFEGDEKIRRIARFAPLMTLDGGHMVNFSDGHRVGRLSPSLLTYLGVRLGEASIAAQGLALYRHQAEEGLNLDELRRDFFNMSRLALRSPEPGELSAAREPAHPDVYFDDYGAIVARGVDARGHRWEFAAKAGHNDEHHNHNDCGGFLLNIDATPACLEIGAPEYVRAFFGPERYTFLAARSLGHSVPFVNGREQGAGRDFRATVLHAKAGAGRVEFAVDLARAYPEEAGCRKLVRDYVFEKTPGRIDVVDTFELAEAGRVESILILDGTAEARDGAVALPLARGTLWIRPRVGTRLAGIETCDFSDHHGKPARVRRARFAPESEAEGLAGEVGYRIEIA